MATQETKTAPPKASRLLIELDCLFDTRLGVLASMGDDALKAALNSNYYNRVSDYFPGIDYDTFKENYSKRDKRTLFNSIVTPIGRFAKEFALATLDNVNNSPFHYQPEIIVNMYPYVLTPDEQTLIVKGVKELTSGLCNIECVFLSPEKLTPLYLKLNLSILVMYEYDKWLEVHAQSNEWKKHTAPDVTLIAPMISMIKTERSSSSLEEAFVEMQKTVAPFVNLKLFPIEKFCLSLKPEHFQRYTESLKQT